LPENLPGLGVERTEQAIVGAAREQEIAASGENRTPVLRRQLGGPDAFAAVEVPCLQLADMIGAGSL
jgi:hypothetical protein